MSAQTDLFRLKLRRVLMKVVLAIAGASAGLVVLIGAVAYVLKGLVGALAAAFGGRAWPAELIVGGSILLLTGLAINAGLRRLTHSTRKKMAQKYDQQHRQQRAACGSDVQQRAQF